MPDAKVKVSVLNAFERGIGGKILDCYSYIKEIGDLRYMKGLAVVCYRR